MISLIFLCIFVLMIACSLTYLVILFISSTIVYSRVAFSLLLALASCQSEIKLVENSGLLNFVAWTFIFLGIIYLLANLPRVDQALRFFCTVFMSAIVINIFVALFGSIIGAIVGSEFRITTLYEILIKIVCTLFALGAMLSDDKPAAYNSSKHEILIHAERLLASAVYGFSAAFLCGSLGSNWNLSGFLAIVIILVTTAAAFFADIYLQDKEISLFKKEKEVTVPK